MKGLTRRAILAAASASGFSGIAAATPDQDEESGSTDQPPNTKNNGRQHDVEIVNHTNETVSGTVTVPHGASGSGPEADFELGTTFVDRDDPQYYQRFSNLPAAGNEYTIQVETKERSTASEDLRMAERGSRNHTSLTISIKESGIDIIKTQE